MRWGSHWLAISQLALIIHSAPYLPVLPGVAQLPRSIASQCWDSKHVSSVGNIWFEKILKPALKRMLLCISVPISCGDNFFQYPFQTISVLKDCIPNSEYCNLWSDDCHTWPTCLPAPADSRPANSSPSSPPLLVRILIQTTNFTSHNFNFILSHPLCKT